MHRTLLGLFVVALFAVCLSLSSDPHALGQHPQRIEGRHGMIALQAKAADGGAQVILINASESVMGVYHVGSVDGKITLQSVRNVKWDMLMEEYNGQEPLPREIRTLMESR